MTAARLRVPLLALAGLAAGATPPSDPVAGIVAAFAQHPVVIIGEMHGLVEAGDLYTRLVRDPAFPAAANDIVIEFASRQSQPLLDRYIAGAEVPAAELRTIWRDTTKVGSWESPIYARWLAVIRDVNRTLPPGRRLRVIAGDTAVDWARLRDHDGWAALGDNNVSFADAIVHQVLERRRKALVVLGSNHVTRTGDRNGGPNTTTRVEAAAKGATWVVLLAAGERAAGLEPSPDGRADAVVRLGPLTPALPLPGSLEPAYLDEVDRRSLIEWGELRARDLRVAAEPDWREDAASPRIDALRRALAAGDAGAAARFWSERGGGTAPLVEPIAGDARHVLVTFLDRPPATTRTVILYDGLARSRDLRAHALARLGASDVWRKTYWMRADMRLDYALLRDPSDDALANAHRGKLELLELPGAPPEPCVRPRPGVPAGALAEEELDSKLLGDRRGAWVYTPPGYDAARRDPYPLLVCFDGWVYTQADQVPTPTILDNLIAEGRIPPVIGVFVAQTDQRNVELTNNPRFVDHVADELLPDVRRRWRATADPALTVVCGSSAGGLASAYAAFRRPAVFGNVLSQSGAFWPGATRQDPGREWLTAQLDAQPRLPIRFVLQVGVVEIGATPGDGPSILATNRHLRDVLLARGYEVTYTEIAGGHSPVSWRGGLATGLVRLLAPAR